MAKRDSKNKGGDWRSQLTDRIGDEVEHIIDEFAKEHIRIEVVPAPNNGLDYLCAAHHILVRAESVNRVVKVLGKAAKKIKPEPVIEGVVLFSIRRLGLSVPDALDLIDKKLGEGIATPDHVFTVAQLTGGEVGVCPATEPLEVYQRCGPFPFPPVCTGNSGSGVRIYLGDTGLLKHAVATHDWLTGVQRAPQGLAGGVRQPWETRRQEWAAG